MLALLALATTPMLGGTLHDFKVETIEGKVQPLAEYKGKVAVVINVASKCGYTKQYAGLQKLYETYKDKGLTILAFPSNDFKGQEPGTNSEIMEFCTKEYGVTFPMFSKIVVKGEGQHPLYKWLIAEGPRHEDIEWNFAKFIVSKKGEIKARFKSNVTPEDPEFLKVIEAELAEN